MALSSGPPTPQAGSRPTPALPDVLQDYRPTETGDLRILGRHLLRFRIINAWDLPDLSSAAGSKAEEVQWVGPPCFSVALWINREQRQSTRVACPEKDRNFDTPVVTWNQPLEATLDPASDELQFRIVSHQETAYAARRVIQSTKEAEVERMTLPRRMLRTGRATYHFLNKMKLVIEVSVAGKAGEGASP